MSFENKNVTCRICMCEGNNVESIFKYKTFSEALLQISQVITMCASIQIQPDDELPKNICPACLNHLQQAFAFKTRCQASDSKFRLRLKQNKPQSIDKSDVIEDELRNLKVEAEKINTLFEPSKVDVNQYDKSSETLLDVSNTEKSTKSVSKLKYKCSECKEEFKTKIIFTKHIKICTSGKPHKCVDCGHGFTRKYDLTLHMITHDKDKPHKCDECNKHFSKVSALKTHKQVHIAKPRYTWVDTWAEEFFECFQCHKKFSDPRKYAAHQRNHIRNMKFD